MGLNPPAVQTSAGGVSRTVDGVKHTYRLDGSLIIAEEFGNHLYLYLYDAEGTPIGLQYRNSSYAEEEFDTYWFEKNLLVRVDWTNYGRLDHGNPHVHFRIYGKNITKFRLD